MLNSIWELEAELTVIRKRRVTVILVFDPPDRGAQTEDIVVLISTLVGSFLFSAAMPLPVIVVQLHLHSSRLQLLDRVIIRGLVNFAGHHPICNGLFIRLFPWCGLTCR